MSTLRLKHVCDVIDVRAGSHRPTLLAVSIHRGVVPREELTEDEPRADDLGMYRLCESGDIVLNRMRAFQGAVGMAPMRGLVSPDYLVLRPRQHALGRYLHYLFRSSEFVGQMVARLRGIGSTDTGTVRTPRINAEDLLDISVRLPPIDEQRAIANYLDREAAEIDSLIAAKEQLLALADERLRAWTFEALEGASASRVPLKAVARWVEGPGIMAHEFRETGIPLLRIRNLVGDTINLDGCGYVEPAMVAARWRHLCVRAGELLVSGSARSGSPVVVPVEADGAVPYTGLIRIWSTTSRLERDFLRLFLTSPQFEHHIDRLKTGVGLQHWGPYHLAQLRIPLPPRESQLAVAAAFRQEETWSAQIRHASTTQVQLLRERRVALITSTVTGELRVPVVA